MKQSAARRGCSVFAIANQKGGVGKTTTAINLSAALAARGRRVLLIDIDPQGNSTTGLGIDKQSLEHCVYDVLLNGVPLTQAIVTTNVEGLSIVPSTLNLAGAEVELVAQLSRERKLANALGRSLDGFDCCIIDCPPSLGLLTVNAMCAADALIVPIQAEYFALEGLGQLTKIIELVRENLNPNLRICGVVVTMYDGRTNLAAQVVDEVERYFPGLVFSTRIPRTIRLSEAPSHGAPISQFDPRNKGAGAYAALADEVLSR